MQHLLAEPTSAQTLLQELDQGGYLFVCGATAMGGDVHSTLVDILVKNKSMTKDAAAAFLTELQKKGRYVQELWSS